MVQFLGKGYSMSILDNFLEVYDATKRLIIKALLANNRTSKVCLNNVETKCFFVAAMADETWLWHLRMYHLNYRDLNSLNSKKLVSGLHPISIPMKECKTCLISK